MCAGDMPSFRVQSRVIFSLCRYFLAGNQPEAYRVNMRNYIEHNVIFLSLLLFNFLHMIQVQKVVVVVVVVEGGRGYSLG